MRILVAPDKFRGTLTAPSAVDAMVRGIRRAMPDAAIDVCPVADGGEGTVDALLSGLPGRRVSVDVCSPLPERRVKAVYGLLDDGTAVIEMAAASGLALVPEHLRNPLHTTTFGTGQLLRDAADRGAVKAILGIGGSATTDAGIGAAQAAGHTVLLTDGQVAHDSEPLCGSDLPRVLMVKRHRGSPVDALAIEVASDVQNPLCGPNGSAVVYGPQKGASPEDVQWLDRELSRLAGRLNAEAIATCPGAGAAGGLGFGLMAFFNARLRSGIDLVLDACDFDRRCRLADLVLTGEGSFDDQSLHGKAVAGVAERCRAAGVPCIVIAGQCNITEPAALQSRGITGVVSLVGDGWDAAAAMIAAVERLAEVTAHVLRD